MMRLAVMLGVMLVSACALSPAPGPSANELALLNIQVRAAEAAFAQTMARRDFATFQTFVADDAVFISDGTPLRGKAQVSAHWQQYFEGAQPPFSWQPEVIEMLDSGALAYSTGPVYAPDGRVVARFASTWRRAADGRWRVILDNGFAVCPPR